MGWSARCNKWDYSPRSLLNTSPTLLPLPPLSGGEGRVRGVAPAHSLFHSFPPTRPAAPRPSPPGRRGEREYLVRLDARQQCYCGFGGRAWAERRRVRTRGRDPWAYAEHDRARDILGDVERALLLQVIEGLAADIADDRSTGDLRAWRERRRRRYRRWRCSGLQDREPQPPLLYRAVPGGGDGGWRHLARCLYNGRAADRDP